MTFAVRKFAAHFDAISSEKSQKFSEFYVCLQKMRTLKNFIIPQIISRTIVSDFKYSGNMAAKRLYDKLRVEIFQEIPEELSIFRERARRNAFFEVYDLIRNRWVRNGWLTQILKYFQGRPIEIQIGLLKNTLNIQFKHDLLKQLTHCYTNKPVSFSIGYLNNLIGELRQSLFSLPFLQDSIWQTMCHLRNSIKFHENIIHAMQTGWIRQRKGQKLALKPCEILPSLVRSYKLATAYKIRNKKELKPELVQQRQLHLKDLDLNRINLNKLMQQALKQEMVEWKQKSCVSRIIRPHYSKVTISTLTQQGFESYLLRKLQYHARSIFSNQGQSSILNIMGNAFTQEKHESFLDPFILTIFGDLTHSITPPIVRSLTWVIKFSEQLYNIENTSTSDKLNETISIILTPYTHHIGFRFNIFSQTIKRLRHVSGNAISLLDLFKIVPVIQLDGQKIIFNQPLNMVQKSTSHDSKRDSSRIKVMGVDLGLKHFAVVSIFEFDKNTMQKFEIGRHFLDQRRVLACRFDSSTLHFSAPYRDDYNIKRHLEHLRRQQRVLSSIYHQMEQDGGYIRTKKYYYTKKSYEKVWKKVRNIHSTLTQQIAHTISEIGQAYNVNMIYFEDLRWSQHSARKNVGRWLSHNQQHFFHSKIIESVTFMAKFRAFSVKKVNARWSSQISWKTQLTMNLNISYKTDKSQIKPYLGNRSQKWFRYVSDDPGLSWCGDSDLNAARNIALRGLIAV